METKNEMNDLAEMVLFMLERNVFERWYRGDFEDYIGGMTGHKSRAQIVADLVEMLSRRPPFRRS